MTELVKSGSQTLLKTRYLLELACHILSLCNVLRRLLLAQGYNHRFYFDDYKTHVVIRY